MDNLAHTLAGAALGEAGLKRLSGLGLPTLMIAANLPDLDVIGLAFGENLAWRRGWTHGPLGLLLLPPLLAAAMIAFDRWQTRRGKRPAGRPPVRWRGLLALAYIGALSHPALDLLNTYGVRLLMPFSDRWFYGDTLFIIDVWLWTALALGVWLSRRRARRDRPGATAPAITSLAAASLYIGVMAVGSAAAARHTAAEIRHRGIPGHDTRWFPDVDEVVSNPVPIDPFTRRVVFRVRDQLGSGEVRFTPLPRLELDDAGQTFVTNMADPAVAAAARADKAAADFLTWSRLPFATIEHRPDATLVTLDDARYSEGPTAGRFARTFRLPPRAPSPGR